ncbi:hypothetical protein JAAARDRAFT_140877 [Jaapia argillacea MUCL 33604]|uniref:Carrier domain-containing protein n=1 Tax=Jaapia argillacea MUCL 33604 TaxID=933084 RepID=A0A067P836_9AGAM|nr:hypothetical protein JAAARDRAFT_140877 [Jaapia argillacea MUCL 33604]
MPPPLAFLHTLPDPPRGFSLGDHLADFLSLSGSYSTLLDCLCSTDKPALWSPESTRPPLIHRTLHHFISNFCLPTSGLHGEQQLGPNDRVMVVLPTGPENALALLAVAAYHTCAPVNSSCTSAELFEDARNLRAKAVVTTPDAADRLELRELRKQLNCEIILVQGRTDGPAGLFEMEVMEDNDEERTWSVIESKGRLHPSRLHRLDDQSLVLHTSGTSGKKKVVPYSLRSLIVGTCCVIKSWDLREEDVNMNMMPLFHVGGIVRNLLTPMFSGGSAIMCSGFDAQAFWSIIIERGATWYYAAPTMHHAILSSAPSPFPTSLMKLRMIANAAGGLLPTLATALRSTFGATILPSYGMTECMPIASPPPSYALDRPGCSGIACGPHLSIRQPGNTERECKRGAVGAVCVRGFPTFEGYEVSHDPHAPLDTSAFSSEGWFDSGDLGYMDEDGYLYITGRSKEIINKGGEVISPFEIEEAVLQVAKDRVDAVLAFSVDHDVLQETIGLVVVPVHNRPRTGISELQELLRDTLHPSKWPFLIVYMDDLPKNVAGKPLRIRLAQRLALGTVSDDLPVISRHFEAQVPPRHSKLSDPIPCAGVLLNVSEVGGMLGTISGVQEVAVRMRRDGSLEALVAVLPEAGLDTNIITNRMLQVLHGYCVPNPIHVIHELFSRTDDGQVDWNLMEREIKRRHASKMSNRALMVRDMVARLLERDPTEITGDSDFFLIGGNSLLLGRLAYFIRKETGASLKVSSIFNYSTINGIATLVDAEMLDAMSKTAVATPTALGSEKFFSSRNGSNDDLETLNFVFEREDKGRRQTHPFPLVVQAIPVMFFYPLKAAMTWTAIVFILAGFTRFIDGTYWERIGSLMTAIIGARLIARVVSPLVAIAFKWVVIGKYRPGVYRFWSNYHLRWWITNQFIRVAGRGVFSMHPSLELTYYRLLGAKIGKDVRIEKMAKLGEYDLLTIHDGARIDKALLRGFCVERDGYFRLDKIVIGKGAVLNTYTQISPGAVIPDGAVYGPHASSYDDAVPESHSSYNRTNFPKPHWALQIFVAMPIIFLVTFVSYIPWFGALFALLTQSMPQAGLNSLETVIKWFASPTRIMWHSLARIIRIVVPPLIQTFLGIIVKRLMGLNTEGLMADATQWSILRRHINEKLLSQYALSRTFDILGTHYETASVVMRAMGAKVGNRVYWPGSGVYCPDPELLEIGDDVVFGSRSEIFTTDLNGSAKVTIADGAMIADRVVLLPGTRVGRRTVMGSGSMGVRNGYYGDGSVWMGVENGHAVCFTKPHKDVGGSTMSPFGKAFYERDASYYVLPLPIIIAINLFVAGGSAGYWSIPAVFATQILNQMRIHLPKLHIFNDNWYQVFTLYGLIATLFVIGLNILTWIAIAWVLITKWVLIGRRKEGSYDWDKSSYCQRWQLHLVLSRTLYRAFGNGGILGNITGSAYIVWYFRAIGAKIGKDCSIFAGGRVGLMTEPDLVQLGDRVALDDCSVVAHINSRGKFSLHTLKIGNSCALRTGSRLLSGASMEDNSMLLEHTLLTSGETAESGSVYAGWPARSLDRYPLLADFKSFKSNTSSSRRLPSCLEMERHQSDLMDDRKRLDEMLRKAEKLMDKVELDNQDPPRSVRYYRLPRSRPSSDPPSRA